MSLPNIPNPPRCSFGSTIVDGNVYIAGGHINQTHHYAADNVTADMNMFDVGANPKEWVSLSPRPIASQGFEMFAYNGYIYALGGLVHYANGLKSENQYISVDQIDRYDIAEDTWETLSVKLPKPRSSYMAGVIDNVVYIFGGWFGKGEKQEKGKFYPGGVFDDEIVMFDMETETVQVAPNKLEGSLRRAGGAVSYNGSIYVMGGFEPHFACSSAVQKYGVDGIFEGYLPSLPDPLFAPGAGVNGTGQLFVFGGYPGNHGATAFTNKVWAFNDTNWQELSQPMTQKKGFVSVVNLEEGLFGLLGGALNPAESGEQSDVFELYPSTISALAPETSEQTILFPD